MQLVIIVATDAPENFPAGQFTQALLFVPSLYRPAPHEVHTPGGAPLYPATHLQSAAAVLPAGDQLFPTQFTAAVVPDPAFHVPAALGKQVPPSAPVYPALHLQSVSNLLALAEKLLVGQLEVGPVPDPLLYVPATLAVQLPVRPVYPALHRQLLSSVAPSDVVALFRAQDEHAALLFEATLNLPRAHAEHVDVSVSQKPALHKQAAAALELASDMEFSRQFVQVPTAVAPVAADQKFALHGVHAAF